MNIQHKYKKIIASLKIPYEQLFTFPNRLLSLESCLASSYAPEHSVVLPKQPNLQLPNIFLRTRKLESVDDFLKENESAALNENWNDIIDSWLVKISNFELLEPEFGNNEARIDEKDLKSKICTRY